MVVQRPIAVERRPPNPSQKPTAIHRSDRGREPALRVRTSYSSSTSEGQRETNQRDQGQAGTPRQLSRPRTKYEGLTTCGREFKRPPLRGDQARQIGSRMLSFEKRPLDPRLSSRSGGGPTRPFLWATTPACLAGFTIADLNQASVRVEATATEYPGKLEEIF